MNYFEFGPLVHQEKMSFKVVSHLELSFVQLRKIICAILVKAL